MQGHIQLTVITTLLTASFSAYLQPVDKLGHVCPHQSGVFCWFGVVFVGPIQPVHNNDIGPGFSVKQSRHKLIDPALQQTCNLQVTFNVCVCVCDYCDNSAYYSNIAK